MILTYTKRFQKRYLKLTTKVQNKVNETLYVFENDFNNPILRNHALIGKLSEYRSIDVTGDYRIIFRELSNNAYELVELVDVGTHAQLY